jgi:hypothetical protein
VREREKSFGKTKETKMVWIVDVKVANENVISKVVLKIKKNVFKHIRNISWKIP